MPVPKEPLPLNCPRCPRKMEYVGTTENGVHVYVCADHGEWHFGPGGLYQPEAPLSST